MKRNNKYIESSSESAVLIRVSLLQGFHATVNGYSSPMISIYHFLGDAFVCRKNSWPFMGEGKVITWKKSYNLCTHTTHKNIFPWFRKQMSQLTVSVEPKGTRASDTNGNANWSKGASHKSELASQYQ